MDFFKHKENFPERQLLNITMFEYTWNDFMKIKSKSDNTGQLLSQIPRYTFGINNNLIEAEYYYQFTGDYEDKNNKEKYYIFNINFASELLSEEISNAGFESLIKEFEIEFEKIITLCFINKYDTRMIPLSTNIVFDFDYIGNDEPELEMSLVGALNDKLEIIKI